MVRLTVSVIGGNDFKKELAPLAQELGSELALAGFDITTGAAEGFPLEVAKGAHRSGGKVYGVSPHGGASHTMPDLGETGVIRMPTTEELESPTLTEFTQYFDHITYTGMGEARNKVLVRTGDAIVAIGGALGTFEEFAGAVHSGKTVAVLEGSGGIADKIKAVAEILDPKAKKTSIVYSGSPKELVSLLRQELNNRRYGELLGEALYQAQIRKETGKGPQELIYNGKAVKLT